MVYGWTKYFFVATTCCSIFWNLKMATGHLRTLSISWKHVSNKLSILIAVWNRKSLCEPSKANKVDPIKDIFRQRPSQKVFLLKRTHRQECYGWQSGDFLELNETLLFLKWTTKYANQMTFIYGLGCPKIAAFLKITNPRVVSAGIGPKTSSQPKKSKKNISRGWSRALVYLLHSAST